MKIKHLGNVNLIVGRNNTGKSSILEALYLYAHRGNIGKFDDILKMREEDKALDNNLKPAETVISSFEMLYHCRDFRILQSEPIGIGSSNQKENFYQFKPTYYSIKTKKEIERSKISKSKNLGLKDIFKSLAFEQSYTEDAQIGFEITIGRKSSIKGLDFLMKILESFDDSVESETPCVFIPNHNLTSEESAKLWDKVSLTDNEQYIIKAMQIIEPTIEKLNFKGESHRRTPFVKLLNEKTPIPAKSLGDGISRLLNIVLAITNSINGMVLIDELGTGLHYSIQATLWDMIFTLAKNLNVQIFATTHSQDCVFSFIEATERFPDRYDLGKIIRLTDYKNVIEAIEFDRSELINARYTHLELR